MGPTSRATAALGEDLQRHVAVLTDYCRDVVEAAVTCSKGDSLRWCTVDVPAKDRSLRTRFVQAYACLGGARMIENQFNIEIDPDWQTTTDGVDSGSLPINKDQYLRGVRTELERILKSEAGRHLAASLRFHARKVLLIPYPGQDGNAQEWWWGNSPQDNHSVVRFTPTSGRSPCGAEIRKKQSASLSHEILFHELVHSLRRVSGKMRGWSLGGNLSGQGNIEEFIAIMVTNIFISDVTNKYKTGLRDDWNSHAPLDPALAESYRFFALGTKAFNLIATFCDDNPGFTKMLAKVRAHFNPVAAYYQNRRKAFEMAANGDSELVFEHMTPLEYVQNASGAWTRLVPRPGPSARK